MPRYSVWLNHSHSPVGCDLFIASHVPSQKQELAFVRICGEKRTTPGGRLCEIRLNFIVLLPPPKKIELEPRRLATRGSCDSSKFQVLVGKRKLCKAFSIAGRLCDIQKIQSKKVLRGCSVTFRGETVSINFIWRGQR